MDGASIGGVDTLISVLDREVRHLNPQAVDGLQDQVSGLVHRSALRLSERVHRPCGNTYARRELYCSPTLGYTVVLITWGPGQGAPLHDHSGHWCLEVVLRGQIEVTDFSLVARDDDRYAFTPGASYAVGVGATACLSPPHEHHTVTNPHDEAAVSLHVYGGSVQACGMFERDGDGWYRRRTRRLSAT